MFRDRRAAHHPLRRARAGPAGDRRAAHRPPGAGAAGLAVLAAVGRPAAPAAGPGAVRGRGTRAGRDPPRAPRDAGLAAVRGGRRRDRLAGLVPGPAGPGPATPTRPRLHQAALDGWQQRAGEHEQAELARLDAGPGMGQRRLARAAHRRLRRHPGRLAVAAGRARRVRPGRSSRCWSPTSPASSPAAS